MEKIARLIARKISLELNYTDEKTQVTEYGLIIFIQTFIFIALVIILGLLFRIPVEALIICFSVSILRKYSGGAHLGTAELCTALGVGACIVFALIGKHLLLPFTNIISLSISLFFVFLFSILVIYKYAPVDNPNKPIRTQKKKKRLRKTSLIILLTYLAISITFLYLGIRYISFNSFLISLMLGIIWQIITLTKIGSIFLEKIDFMFNKVK